MPLAHQNSTCNNNCPMNRCSEGLNNTLFTFSEIFEILPSLLYTREINFKNGEHEQPAAGAELASRHSRRHGVARRRLAALAAGPGGVRRAALAAEAEH
ncbi:putative N-methylproline demethylase [Frankliniella fusca]|uniref:N-methylproline demethylase n=1 Tax=Frankliniella fusca TaxID=407009 RepID=A0AAE1LQ47_9NEOP|nr:putative N-methylproline demethylase [Frankliniella fusca]